MTKAPEKYRNTSHPIRPSDASYGNNGFFTIPHYRIDGYWFNVMISDGMGWEHVSVTLVCKKPGVAGKVVERCCTWEEMCFIKSVFWHEDECVVQFHPPSSEHISNHPYCLHLWKPVGIELPMPPSDFVGTKAYSVDKLV